MIELDGQTRSAMIDSIRRYFEEELDESVGELKATLMLDYFLKELAPVVYNKAVSDSTRYMQERAAEMDGTLFEPEYTYWKR